MKFVEQCGKILKSKIDEKSYKIISLENGLEIMLIYDKETDFSAGSMSVKVGSKDESDS